jgi:hypothetical protein
LSSEFNEEVFMSRDVEQLNPAGLPMSQVDYAALRAIAGGGVEAALRTGTPTHETFRGFEVEVRRIDQLTDDIDFHPSRTAVRCVISRCGTMIESHEWVVSESMKIRFNQARD